MPDALPDMARRGGLRDLKNYPESRGCRRTPRNQNIGGGALLTSEDDFLVLLDMAEDEPPVLMLLGDPVHLIQPAIAIVSNRDASTSERRFTGTLATEIVAAGNVAVSGMARDNETSAHIATVSFGTAAVLASGVGIVYLRENVNLRAHIIESGTVVSAMPVGVKPQGRHFPRPNRIISSISRAVIVV